MSQPSLPEESSASRVEQSDSPSAANQQNADGSTDDFTQPKYRYRRWRNARALDEPDIRIFQEHANTLWKKRLLFEFCFILKPGMEDALAGSIDALSQQYYDGWRLSIFARTPSPEEEFLQGTSPVRWLRIPDDVALEDFIDAHLIQTSAHWVGFFECGTRFEPQLLLSLSDFLAIHPEWHAIYTDEDTLGEDGEPQSPAFKPDFNLELLRSTDYIGPLFVDRNALLAVGGYSKLPDAASFDGVLRVADAYGDSAIGHVPDVLIHAAFPNADVHTTEAHAAALSAHFARRKIDAEILPGLLEGVTRRVLYRHSGTPRVSIIMPTRNHPELLGPCVESLFRHTAWPDWELLLVDNGSDDPDVRACYETLLALPDERVRVLDFPESFNFSAMNNLAARAARGEYLLLLNNDIECIHDDWLDAMMAHAQRPDVGAVGARLLFPDSLKVQHAGIVLGINGTADHVFVDSLTHDEPGYLNRALADQEYSAVTGACLLMRRSLYTQIGGLDEEAFRVSFCDVDLCLKIRKLGYRVIWTPFATLLHRASATQNEAPVTQARVVAFQHEVKAFHQRWGDALVGDPAWNRNLSLAATDPTVEDELAAPWQREFHDRPRVVAMPPINGGVAEYRCFVPLRALRAAGKIQCTVVCQPRANFERAPMPVELARMAPDTLFMQNPVDNVRCLKLLDYRWVNSNVFRVYTLDDLITHLPVDNPSHSHFPAEMMEARLALGLTASHRLIVSTEPLAEAYRHMIDDIRIVPNMLPWSVWGPLRSKRRRGKKLRVGWTGAQQHAGDLRFLLEVVEATRNEVEWVFMGMLPEGIDSGAVEFHGYVVFSSYPEKLASLDLDLALAPLEQHPFNEAKSNLHLLEYGALGWPVICTDIFPYWTDDPPVTRLPNDTARWIAAIRERVADPDALAREGDAMRAWVEKHYRLEDHLDLWMRALLPD
ncbi:MAG: glycosyltransferase [Candidatus Accumulibacter sp.]|jgi:GT2 family glycosyltransferase/glycosyltransferase involved in cell wall biosynthesis|nr:glycosyltransferase [Accumulibacter sp.]